MGVPRMRLSSAWLGMLVFLAGSGLSPSASHGQEKTEPPKELEVSYEAFDQRPGSGWRKERDCKKLTSFREEIAKGRKLQGVVPNLDIVDRLIEYFDEPYSVAYRGKPKKSE